MISVTKTDQEIINLHLNAFKASADLAKLDKAHLDWEITHMSNTFEELRHDIGRVISTLEGKGFNAGKPI